MTDTNTAGSANAAVTPAASNGTGVTAAPTTPTATPEKKKRTAKPKVDYVPADKSILNAEGKLSAVPTDFLKSHKPLKEDSFASPSLYYAFKAGRLEAQAASLRRKAAQLEKFGNVKDQKAAAQLVKTYDKLLECRATLAAGGMSDEEISKMLGIDIKAIIAKATEAGATVAQDKAKAAPVKK